MYRMDSIDSHGFHVEGQTVRGAIRIESLGEPENRAPESQKSLKTQSIFFFKYEILLGAAGWYRQLARLHYFRATKQSCFTMGYSALTIKILTDTKCRLINMLKYALTQNDPANKSTVPSRSSSRQAKARQLRVSRISKEGGKRREKCTASVLFFFSLPKTRS